MCLCVYVCARANFNGTVRCSAVISSGERNGAPDSPEALSSAGDFFLNLNIL